MKLLIIFSLGIAVDAMSTTNYYNGDWGSFIASIVQNYSSNVSPEINALNTTVKSSQTTYCNNIRTVLSQTGVNGLQLSQYTSGYYNDLAFPPYYGYPLQQLQMLYQQVQMFQNSTKDLLPNASAQLSPCISNLMNYYQQINATLAPEDFDYLDASYDFVNYTQIFPQFSNIVNDCFNRYMVVANAFYNASQSPGFSLFCDAMDFKYGNSATAMAELTAIEAERAASINGNSSAKMESARSAMLTNITGCQNTLINAESSAVNTMVMAEFGSSWTGSDQTSYVTYMNNKITQMGTDLSGFDSQLSQTYSTLSSQVVGSVTDTAPGTPSGYGGVNEAQQIAQCVSNNIAATLGPSYPSRDDCAAPVMEDVYNDYADTANQYAVAVQNASAYLYSLLNQTCPYGAQMFTNYANCLSKCQHVMYTSSGSEDGTYLSNCETNCTNTYNAQKQNLTAQINSLTANVQDEFGAAFDKIEQNYYVEIYDLIQQYEKCANVTIATDCNVPDESSATVQPSSG